MKKSKKWINFVGAILIGVGVLICLIAFTLSGFDFTKAEHC